MTGELEPFTLATCHNPSVRASRLRYYHDSTEYDWWDHSGLVVVRPRCGFQKFFPRTRPRAHKNAHRRRGLPLRDRDLEPYAQQDPQVVCISAPLTQLSADISDTMSCSFGALEKITKALQQV